MQQAWDAPRGPCARVCLCSFAHTRWSVRSFLRCSLVFSLHCARCSLAPSGYQRAFYPKHSVSEIDTYINTHFERFVEHLFLLPGCEETLEAAVAALGGDMSRMAICTNSPLPIVQIVFKHCPVLQRFFTPERTFCAGDMLAIPTAQVQQDDAHPLHRLALSDEERLTIVDGPPQLMEYQIKAKPTGDLIFASSQRLGVRHDLCLFVGDSKSDHTHTHTHTHTTSATHAYGVQCAVCSGRRQAAAKRSSAREAQLRPRSWQQREGKSRSWLWDHLLTVCCLLSSALSSLLFPLSGSI